jgi:hypothetical protein
MKVRIFHFDVGLQVLTLQEILQSWLSKNADKAIRFITQSESVEGLGNRLVTVIIWYEDAHIEAQNKGDENER